MIQIYDPNNTNFSQNGDETLLPSSATVHAILNGSWSAALEHPIDQGGRWKLIQIGAVIKMPSFLGKDQLFRIKDVKKADSGISAEMEPIFYDAMDDCFLVDVRPTNDNGQQALDLMTGPNSKYIGQSNITTTSTAYYQYKNLMEAINGNDDNSFINRWGGEILFDDYTVIINDHVGGDYGVEIRYGKNTPSDGLTEEVDIRDVVTRIYPKAYNGYEMTDHGYVDSPLIGSYPTIKTRTIAFDDVRMASDVQSSEPEDGVIVCETQAELDEALTQKCEEQYAAGIDKPVVSIKANMILLKNTEQYKDYAVLEDVSLGDKIGCINNHLGIATSARVIDLVYDSVKKAIASVVIGDTQYNYFNNVSSSVNKVERAIRPDGTVIAEQIAGFLDGALTSLRAQYNVAQKQDVMSVLFENLDPDSPLYGALGIGTQGIMISKTRTSDGRGWDWTSAMTANGLMAGIIVAGILSDKLGKNWWNLDTGEFVTTQGMIGGWNIGDQAIYKDVTASDGTIYRVYLQPPLQSNPDETWILSCQRSTDGGNTFYGNFILYANGEARFGSLDSLGYYLRIRDDGVLIFDENGYRGGFWFVDDGVQVRGDQVISGNGWTGRFAISSNVSVDVQNGIVTGIVGS